jgi:hypothetical protein
MFCRQLFLCSPRPIIFLSTLYIPIKQKVELEILSFYPFGMKWRAGRQNMMYKQNISKYSQKRISALLLCERNSDGLFLFSNILILSRTKLSIGISSALISTAI